MFSRFRSFFAIFILAVVILACSSSFEILGTSALPTPSIQPLVNTPTDTPSVSADILPHALYFLNDGQIFRIERDGKMITQLTFDAAGVTDYDVSAENGNIAYVSNNRLILVDFDGSNPRVLMDGGPRENNFWVTNPVFSPDGMMIAYGYKGLRLYDILAGTSLIVIEDQNSLELLPNGLPFPLETYVPDSYSPDGTKLLVSLGRWESAGTAAVYDLSSNTLIRYSTAQDEYINCCSFYGGAEWSADSSSYYGIASAYDYSFSHGALWKVDATSGTVTTLISEMEPDGTLNLPYGPHPAPDGGLYYFFLNYPEPGGFVQRPPLQLVRSAPDGVTDRTILLPQSFELMNEALWAPDAKFVIVAFAPSQNEYDGGRAEIVYLDGRPSVLLTASAGNMKWGP